MKTNPYIQKLEAKYEKLKAEIKDKRSDLKIRANQESALQELEAQQERLRSKIIELKESSKDRFEQLKAQTEEALGTLQTKWNALLDKAKA